MPETKDSEAYGAGRSTVASDRGEIQQLREEVRTLREQQDRLQAPTNPQQAPREPEPGVAPAPPKQDVPAPPAKEKSRSWIREHPIKALLGLMILIFVVAGALLVWSYSQQFEDTDDAQIDGHVNAISSRVGGTITTVYVQENQEVKAGQLLVELDPRDYQVELERAQANVNQAQAQVRAQQPAIPIASTSATTGPLEARADVAAAEAGLAAAEQQYQSQLAKVVQAEANNQRAQADLERFNQLVQKDEVSRQDYDQRVAAAKSAAATV